MGGLGLGIKTRTRGLWSRESGIGNRESGIGNKGKGIGNLGFFVFFFLFLLPFALSLSKRSSAGSGESVQYLCDLVFFVASQFLS